MTARLATADGKALYALRRQTIEPVFGQIKDVRGARRFLRRGLAACEAEWKLLCGTHNLLKLWRYTRSRPAPKPLAT
jgi:Transposase DDE domain